MMITLVELIKKIIKQYTKTYMFENRAKDLAVQVRCRVNDENKEFLLNDIDKVLPYGMNFCHTYNENGWLTIVFKEIQ